MSSTVTTFTVSALTSTTLASTGSLLAMLLLLAFVIHKDIIVIDTSPKKLLLNRVLGFAMTPLTLMFATLLVIRVAQIIN